MSVGTILLIILILLLVGALPNWSHSKNWGYGPTGGLGLVPSANLHPGRHALFEPVHGSAPDIARQGIANPLGAISCVALLLEHLGAVEAAHDVRLAVRACVRTGPRTRDLGGTAGTEDVGAWVAEALADGSFETSPQHG